MVAYTDTIGFDKNSAGFPSSYTDRLGVAEIILDFAKIAAARVAAGAAALTATDTLVIAKLPKGAFVVTGSATLMTAEGAARTIAVGVAGSTTLWASSFSLNAAAGTTVGQATVLGYHCDVETSILLTVNTSSTDVAKVKISLAVLNMGADLGTS